MRKHTPECLMDTLSLGRAYRALHFAIEDLATSSRRDLKVRLNPGGFNGTNLMVGTGNWGGSIPSRLVLRSLRSWKKNIERTLTERRVNLKSLIKVGSGRRRDEDF